MTLPLLIELLCEEMPSRDQIPAAEQLKENVSRALQSAHVEFAADKVQVFSTPRRIAVLFDEVAVQTADRHEEIKGPKVSAAEQAIGGFLKKHGLKNNDELQVRDAGGEPTYFYVSHQKGGNTADLLAEVTLQAIGNHKWKKSMRFGNQTFAWVRPLKNILVMLGDKIIKGELSLGNDETLPFGDGTFGHARLHAGEKIILSNAKDYEKSLKEKSVIAHAEKRRDMIWKELNEYLIGANYQGGYDEKLLREITGLLEFPYFATGNIDKQFMNLPQEVLMTAMGHHQKYFYMNYENEPAPHFAFVANMPASDDIIKGNERVLRARLQDAEFLYEEDHEVPLTNRVAELAEMDYFQGLGTMADKVERLLKLAVFIAPIFGLDKKKAQVTARLLKADLMTEMVGEFPELQGIMGAEYAKAEKYDDDTVQAIRFHYGTGWEGNLSKAMSLIDKADHLTGFWLVGKQPSGSKDPFALRRAALGIVRIIGSGNISVDLQKLFTKSLEIYALPHDKNIAQELIQFCLDRYRTLWEQENLPYDILDAVFDSPHTETDLLQLREKVKSLQIFLQLPTSADATAAIKRIANILKAEKQFGSVAEKLLTAHAEKQLWEQYNQLFTKPADDYGDQLKRLSQLRAAVDNFFDNVMVNDDDKKIRQNRLNLLKMILNEADKVADFSKLVDR